MDEHSFKLKTRFDKDHFVPEVVGNVELLPRRIEVGNVGHEFKVDRELGMYVVARRHSIADTWDQMSEEMQIPRSTLNAIYKGTIKTVKTHYGVVVNNLDYTRIVPLLDEWCDTVEDRREGMDLGRGTRHALFSVDGKAWEWSRPGEGKAAFDLAMKASIALGLPLHINLIQRGKHLASPLPLPSHLPNPLSLILPLSCVH